MSLKVSPPIIFYLLLKLSNPEQIPNSVFVCFSILASKWGKSPQEKPSTNPVENKGGCNNSMYSSVPFILHLVQLVMGSNPEHSIYAFQDLDFWSNATICILVIHCVVSLNRILKIKEIGQGSAKLLKPVEKSSIISAYFKGPTRVVAVACHKPKSMGANPASHKTKDSVNAL